MIISVGMMAWWPRNKKKTVLFVITMKPLAVNWPIFGSIALNRKETPAGETHKGRLTFLFSKLDPEKMLQKSRGRAGFAHNLLHGWHPL